MRSSWLQLLVTLVAAAAAAGVIVHLGPPPDRNVLYASQDRAYVRRALAWGVSPNASQETCPWTLLNFAVLRKDMETINLLIDAGADLNSCGKAPRTALHFAMQYGNAEIIGRFLDAGADVTAKDSKGRTPLEYEGARNSDVARVLREHGVRRRQ